MSSSREVHKLFFLKRFPSHPKVAPYPSGKPYLFLLYINMIMLFFPRKPCHDVRCWPAEIILSTKHSLVKIPTQMDVFLWEGALLPV